MQQNTFRIGDVRAFWDGVADEYDRINSGFSWTHTERFETALLFLPEREKADVVNIWSRTGDATQWIRKKIPGATIRNFEVSPRMIERAQVKYPHETFEVTDLHDLPCATESQDVVLSLETLEHVPDPLHFLLECHRILRVGGTLILSTPPSIAELPLRLYEHCFANHGEGPHRFRSVHSVLQALRNCGFTVVEHRGTVLCPVGPDWLKKPIEWFQQHLLRYIGTNRLGIRHFFVAEKRESRDPVWAKIHEEIIRPGLCMHSGTAVGLSEGTLRMKDMDGICVPEPTGTGPIPPVCYNASPEIHPSYPEMNASVFGKPEPRSSLLGEYNRIAVGHSTDPDVRRGGASGGILTATILHLLETEKIRGAVVLGMDPDAPWRAKPMIARTKEEILAAAQSKYVVSPVNVILADLEKEEGPLAYVGLPHQVFAIRRLQQMQHPSVRSIAYVFGPFFGNELFGTSIDSFLRKFRVKKENIAALSYRTGEWPGHMEVTLKDGKKLRMKKFHANYLIPFHITQSSLLSHDLTNEFTDLSGGDAWAPVYEKRGQGFSLVISRSEKGKTLLLEMEQAGKVELKDITEEEAIQMQSHGLDLKKRGTFLRIDLQRKKGKRVPEYGLVLAESTRTRRLFERVLSSLFVLCSLPLSRWLVDRTPNWIVGTAFEQFRTVWKACTRNMKRTGLSANSLTIRN